MTTGYTKHQLKSHINLLKKNGVSIAQITNENVGSILDQIRLKSKDGKTKRKPSNNYISSILASLKTMNPDIAVKFSELPQFKYKKRVRGGTINIDKVNTIQRVFNYIVLYKLPINPPPKALVELKIILLLFYTTDVTLNNIGLITYFDVASLANNMSIPIIRVNEKFESLKGVLQTALIYKYSNYTESTTINPIGVKREYKFIKKESGLYNDEYKYNQDIGLPNQTDSIITSPVTVLNKKIKELAIYLAAADGQTLSEQRYGITQIIKYINVINGVSADPSVNLLDDDDPSII